MAKAPVARPVPPTPAPAPAPTALRTQTQTRTQTLSVALSQSEPLVLLMQRMRASKARFDVVAPLLPEGLRLTVRAGPLDHESWTLLVEHSASAAKLRQSLPTLLAALDEQGWQPLALKVKVLARR